VIPGQARHEVIEESVHGPRPGNLLGTVNIRYVAPEALEKQ